MGVERNVALRCPCIENPVCRKFAHSLKMKNEKITSLYERLRYDELQDESMSILCLK